MPEVPQCAQIFRFGIFEVDCACRELREHGSRIRLQEQPFQILISLLDHAGELVSRDELCHKVWPPDTFVDFEQGLGTAIKKLRQSLGDDADAPRYIETLHKRGYRFIAPVEKSAARLEAKPDQVSGAVPQLGPKPPISDAVAKPARHHWLIAAIALLALAFVAVAFWHIKREAVISVSGISPQQFTVIGTGKTGEGEPVAARRKGWRTIGDTTGGFGEQWAHVSRFNGHEKQSVVSGGSKLTGKTKPLSVRTPGHHPSRCDNKVPKLNPAESPFGTANRWDEDDVTFGSGMVADESDLLTVR